jgi:hypothetical protein
MTVVWPGEGASDLDARRTTKQKNSARKFYALAVRFLLKTSATSALQSNESKQLTRPID